MGGTRRGAARLSTETRDAAARSQGELLTSAAVPTGSDNRRLHVVRKEIARIYTIMRERELGLSAEPSEVTA